jgi:hypothetical protein
MSLHLIDFHYRKSLQRTNTTTRKYCIHSSLAYVPQANYIDWTAAAGEVVWNFVVRGCCMVNATDQSRREPQCSRREAVDCMLVAVSTFLSWD